MGPEHRVLFLVVLVVVAEPSTASHFRGAIISWKPGSRTNEIVVNYRISWRMTYSHNFICNDKIILNQTKIGGEGNLECFHNCSTSTISALYYTCTDYSTSEDWSSGLGTIQHTFSTNSLVHDFGFQGTAWISTLNYGSGGNWYLWVKADLSVRSDNRKINTSPTAEIPPIVRLQQNCSHTISIAVNDPDGDVVKCVWAYKRNNYCGSVCHGFPNSTLNSENCTIHYDAFYQTGWFAVAIQVEDYRDVNSTTYMSSVPVQFLVNVYQSSNQSCAKTTEFIYPTPPEDACIGVPKGQTFKSAIVVRVNNEETSVSEIKTISPLGLWHSELYNVSESDWRVNFTYTQPTNNSDVTKMFCFIAKETSGLESDKRCITLLAGVNAPSFVNGSQTPNHRVHPSNRNWNISVDSVFKQAERQSFIRLFTGSGQLVETIDASDDIKVTVQNTSLHFITKSTLREKESYYILFDFGVVKAIRSTYCGAESLAVEDPTFWTFRVRDITPPKLSWIIDNHKTNATAELEWSFDEMVNSTCTLRLPNGTSTTFTCNNTWAESGLVEGNYTLNINSTDLEGNQAFHYSQWIVDTTPPVLTLTAKPAAVSNKDQVLFKWTCTAPCSTTCIFYEPNNTVSANCSSLTSYSWNLPSRTSNITYRFTLEAIDDVGNEIAVDHQWKTDFQAPMFTYCSRGQNFTINCTTPINPEATCNVSVTDNMDNAPVLKHNDSKAGKCGVIRTWTAEDIAGNIAKYIQNISIITSAQSLISHAPGPMSVACGALDDMSSIITSIFKVKHPCNLDVKFTYEDNPKSHSCDIRINRTWTIDDGCGKQEKYIQLLRIQQAKEPLSPINGETGVNLNTYLQWQGLNLNVIYEVYLWVRGSVRPENATFVTYNSYYRAQSLSPATQYQWQIVYYSSKEDTYFSPIWVFETQKFADLIVRQIIIPPTGLTGESYKVKWTVENIGNITTLTSYWTDDLYLSWDTAYNNPKLIARVDHHGVLYINDGYSGTASFTLEERKWGSAYISVHTDIWNQEVEYNLTNNKMTNTTNHINVQLTPPPDLLVSSIRPSDDHAFSGKSITVAWTIMNAGVGQTKHDQWYDRVWISPTRLIGQDARLISTLRHSGNLALNATYNTTTTIEFPEFTDGQFYIIIQTDVFDDVFEYKNENNTFSTEKPINVLLTQAPDLQVRSMDTPEVWTTGETVTIKWIVQNFGNRSPLSQLFWQDSVVMESKANHDTLGITSHYGVMESNSTYTSSITFYISPDILSGVYDLTVWTDYRDLLFEYKYDNTNNKLTKTITVNQSLPDLNVTELSVSIRYDSNSTIAFVNWTTENIGTGNTITNSWTDSVQILYSGGNIFNAIQHHVKTKNGGQHLEKFTMETHFSIPLTIYDVVRFRVLSDVFAITGDKNIHNNAKESSEMNLRLRAADFSISEGISVSENLQGGEYVSVTYTVRNSGSREVENTYWRDRIFITNSIQKNIASYGLNSINWISENVKCEEHYISTVSFTLPKEMAGVFYVYVDVNYFQEVFEAERTANNRAMEIIRVEPAPAADLSITSVDARLTGSLEEEKVVMVEWWVKNIGNSMDRFYTWHDRVLLKPEPFSNVLYGQQTFAVGNNLESQASYQMTRYVALPSDLSGNVYLCVEADIFETVYERNARQNNFLCFNEVISIKRMSPAKLSAKLETVRSKDTSNLLLPGAIVEVKFSVQNTGGLATDVSSWIDSIYMVNSVVNSVSEIKLLGYHLHDALHIGALDPNETYSVVTTFTLPNTHLNKPSLYVLANNTESDKMGKENPDSIDSIVLAKNATSSVHTYIGSYHEIQMSNTLPNLEIESNMTLNGTQGGQPITVEYKVKNTGNATVEKERIWYDSAYLSDDMIIDAFDIKLSYVVRSMHLDSGEEAIVNMSFILPLDLQTKSYVLAIMIDSRDDVFEDNEDDNQLQLVLDIEGRASTDILISKVIAPENVEFGRVMEIRWNVTNNGTFDAYGYKCDSVYLSEDKKWDINDVQVGEPSCSIFSLKGNSMDKKSYFIQSETPNAASMSYNTIVKSRSNIRDPNLENNVAAADQKTNLSYRVLAINSSVTMTLHRSLSLRIPEIMADETLVVNVTSDNREVYNNVFIKAGSPATLFDFDKSSDNPNEPNHIVAVPNTRKGDYYILVHNVDSLSNTNEQNISISAKYARFEILNIYPKFLLSDATTTLRFDGTLIPYDSKVCLESQNGSTFDAISTYVFSSSEAYATFIIPKYMSESKFSVMFTSITLNTSISIPDAVSVRKGVKGFLVSSVETPSSLRIGETGILKLNLQNAGDSDLLVPLVVITATGDGEIKLIDDTTPYQFNQKYFIFGVSMRGPAGILPPKTYTTIEFETKQNQPLATILKLTTSVLKIDKDTPNPFLEQKESFRPTHYDEQSWEPVWKRFISLTGNNTLSLVSTLSNTLNEMSLAGRYVRDVEEIIKFLLKISDSSFADRTLLRIIDFEISSDLNVPMLLDRYLSTRIGSRSQNGPMGKGWILPLWDTAIKQYNESSVLTLTMEKEDYDFVPLNETYFLHTKIGSVTATPSEFRHRLFRGDKEYRFERQTHRLTKVASLIDDSYVDLKYENNLLTKLEHSSGCYVDVKYDPYGRIHMMQLKGYPLSRDLIFTYDFDTGMLVEVRRQDKRTRFSYNHNDLSLSYMQDHDGSLTVFDYSNGEVISRKVLRNGRNVVSREYTYSQNGRVSVHVLPENKTYNLTFDETGNVILIQRNGFFPDKTVMTSMSETQYDGEMVVTKRTLQNNQDSFVIEDGNGDGIGTSFNDKGQLVAFNDGNGNQYKITLNTNGSLKFISFPDGTNKTYVYEQNGHFIKTQTGAVKRYEYNHERKLVMKDIGNGSITTYSYDEKGKLLNFINENVKVNITNADDRITNIAYPDHSISYTYNQNGQVSSIFASSGYNVKYEYDDNGHIHIVKDGDNRILLTAVYDGSGKILKKTLGNNATTIYKYDKETGLLRNLSNYFPNSSLASYFSYKYSTRNRRISINTHEGIWKFGYDRAGQVVLMVDPKGTRTEFVYDKSKNRKIISIGGVEYSTVVNEMNQYTKYGNTKFSFDKNGNMIEKNGTDQEFYTFDEDNKLVAFKTSKHDCMLKYDGLDNLYLKECSNETTRYVINPLGNFGSDVIEMVTMKDGKKIVEQFYHGGDQIGLIAGRNGNDSLNYFQFDPLGSVLGILDEKGELLNRYLSDPFGKTISSTETVGSKFTFVGQWGVVQFEELTGVFYMRSRFYDGETGRFFSIDSFGIKAHSKNFYVYCSNSPVHFNDPGGNCPLCIGFLFGSAKTLISYGISTPLEDWTLGGATGAAVSGGIRGLVASTPFFVKIPLHIAADLLSGYLQRKIDHQPYSWNEAKSDLIRSAIGEANDIVNNIDIVNRYRRIQRTSDSLRCLADFHNCFEPKLDELLRKVAYIVDKGEKIIRWIASHDPNDILGPPGFGAARFISKNSVLQYKIRFENDANATAPAQRVYIKHKYSDHLDPRTFYMGDIGFGQIKKTLPVGSKSFQGSLDLPQQNKLMVKIFAGIDVVKQMVIWEFQTIDLKTGEAPTDPQIGFLPPNNGSSGQGFVTFSMKPKPDVSHLSTIHTNASIYFDNNEPIDTPNIINTVDDQSPNMTGSIINGTESADSVTLSLKATDLGSGVNHVDIFKWKEGQFVMLKAGITENIYVLSLEPGDAFSLVTIAVDEVGNRVEIDKVEPSAFINISSPVVNVVCNCSGNGNCSENSDICTCNKGYYGANCNSSIRPPEPPVLELKSSSGFANQPIPLTISARNMSGSLDELQIVVYGFPPNTNFSKGYYSDDGNLTLNYTEFGEVNMTTDQNGEIELTVQVNQHSDKFDFTREDILRMIVYPRLHAEIQLDGCFSENNNSDVIILVNSSILADFNVTSSKNKSFIIPHTLQIKVPSWVHPVGQFRDTGVYTLEDTWLNGVLILNGKFEKVFLSATLTVKPDGIPEYNVSKELEVERFCGGECDKNFYGVKCDKTCACELENTVSPWCDKFTGSCVCAPEWKGENCNETACTCNVNNIIHCDPVNQKCTCKAQWTGDTCDVDVDECNITSICDVAINTFCENWQGGYDCRCLAGYWSDNGTCVECTDGWFGMNCSEKCLCELNNTLHCNRQSGSCRCKPGWEGKVCNSDVDECSNMTICELHPYTACQNKEWGYDCVCMVGYKLEKDRCVECTEGWYGMQCKDKCSCEVNNTVHCNKQNGSCTCKSDWEGKYCESDVDECSNKTICELQPHTVCQNREWGYDCLCIVGYELEKDRCVECKEGWYGINCKDNCSCEVNNTVQCNKQNGSCTCKPNWEGKDCDSDVDECSNKTICEIHPHTVCQNREWGYDCLCVVGFEQLQNNSCVAVKSDLPANNNSTTTPEEADEIKSTSVVIHLELNLTSNVNLQAASTYKEYKEKAKSMLTNYYEEHLGESFIEVIIKNLTKGSLVIDHDVKTKNMENVTQALTVAVVEMASPKASPLVFDGKNVSVTGLKVNNVNVSGSEGLCTAFVSVANCQTGCEVNADNKPTCSVLTPSKDNTVLIISVTCGSVVAIAVLVVVAVICYRRRRHRKKTENNERREDDVQLKRTHDNTKNEDGNQAIKGLHSPWYLNPFYNSEQENASQIIYSPKRDTERLQVRSSAHRQSEQGSKRDESPWYLNPIYDQEYEHASNTGYNSYTSSNRPQIRGATHNPVSSRYSDYKPEEDDVIRDGNGSKRSSATLDLLSRPQRFEQHHDQRIASSSFYRPYRGETMTNGKVKQDENEYIYRGNIHGKSFKN